MALAPDLILPDCTFTFFVANAPTVWRVTEAQWTERLSEVPTYMLELAADDVGADPDTLLGVKASFEMRRGSLVHHRGGVVISVADRGMLASHRVCRVEIAPSLWVLGQRSNYRVFQDVDVIAIVQDVLHDAGLYQDDGALRIDVVPGRYPRREYCVQFRETDLVFVMRLLEQEGVTFFVRHDGTTETLCLFDAETNRWDTCATLDGSPVALEEDHPELRAAESIQRLDWSSRLVPSAVVLRDYNFTAPGAVIDMTRSSGDTQSARCLYDYPGSFALGDYRGAQYTTHNGARLAATVLGTHETQARTGRGDGLVTGFEPGRRVGFAQLLRNELEARRHVLTGVEHRFRGAEELAHDTGARARMGARYENRFECIPDEVVFRPKLVTPRPVARGAETATVMALPGSTEEICTDVYGRILVLFHWDRLDQRTRAQRGTQSSCWIRVAGSWSGGTWGSVTIPRVGMEVVVQFLDGDPDRPLVTGCVFNGANTSAIDLPANRTRTTLRTNSSPGGNGFNELTFEDAAQQEHIYLRAQRDFRELVRNDHSTDVLNDQSNHVVRDQTENIDRHQTITVQGNRTKTVVGDERETVRGDRTRSVVGHESVHVAKNQSTTVVGSLSEHVQGMRSRVVDAGQLLLRKLFGVDITIGPQANVVVGPVSVSSTQSITHTVLSTSTVRLDPSGVSTTAPTVSLKAGKGSASSITMQDNKIVLSSGGGATLTLEGGNATLSATKISITASGEVDVKGSPVKLNC